MENFDSIIQGIAIYALPVIFAITFHEAAHGYIAKHFGDSTAYQAGRISLNPIKHIDPMGTIIVPLTLFIIGKLTMGTGFYSVGPNQFQLILVNYTTRNAICYGLLQPDLLQIFLWHAVGQLF